MLMALDTFIFRTDTLLYQELQRQTEWKFASAERFGVRDASQFIGPGADKITLPFIIYPGQFGLYSSLDTLRDMADQGEAWQLMAGTGDILGYWSIRSISDRRSNLFSDGVARKSDGAIELQREAA
ncbi:MAG: phage tail protein [Asticcacaulis sp.]|uniref:phage tail protein n=1 Tax=Asticcacaulis sp. TaxID=1872648 RepID=UPI003F7C803C